MLKHLLMTPALIGVALFSGQSPSAPPRSASLDEVVAEVHALRQEMRQATESSFRAQLLVARLQVEEQRINGLARQLAETEDQIRALDGAKNPMVTQMLKQFQSEPAQPGEPDMLAGVKAQLERIENGDPVLKERQASLSRALADEQARWIAFNEQLEALEKTMSTGKK